MQPLRLIRWPKELESCTCLNIVDWWSAHMRDLSGEQCILLRPCPELCRYSLVLVLFEKLHRYCVLNSRMQNRLTIIVISRLSQSFSMRHRPSPGLKASANLAQICNTSFYYTVSLQAIQGTNTADSGSASYKPSGDSVETGHSSKPGNSLAKNSEAIKSSVYLYTGDTELWDLCTGRRPECSCKNLANCSGLQGHEPHQLV